jgi:hypothetical protein
MGDDIRVTVDSWLELCDKKKTRIPHKITIESVTGVCQWKAHRSGAYFCALCGGVNVYQLEGAEDYLVCADCAGTFELKVRECEWRKKIGAEVHKAVRR